MDTVFHTIANQFINISTQENSEHTIGATFIGINTNISGNQKLHVYILLFPFYNYCNNNNIYSPNQYYENTIYCKDAVINVGESFYLWLYEEMKNTRRIVVMSFDTDTNVYKVVGGYGDLLISINNECKKNNPKKWMDLCFDDWFARKPAFDNEFTITCRNPFLYTVPFPVKPIIISTRQNTDFHYIDFNQ